MKIGILTFHAALNYGSALQAYALQEYLSARGHDVHVIDFRSQAQRRLYPSPVSLNSVYNAKQTARRLLSGWGEIRSMNCKRRAFRNFSEKNLHLTDKCFMSEKSLRLYDWSSFDMIVSGSDQIWNPDAMDFSTAYFLDFLDRTAGRGLPSGPGKIAYAPSSGKCSMSGNISRQKISGIRDLIAGYDRISVRESTTLDFLSGSGLLQASRNQACPVMPDPVLLHDMDFYRKVAERESSALPESVNAGKYILYYSPGRQDRKAEMLADSISAGLMGKNSAGVLPKESRREIVRISDGAQCRRTGQETFTSVIDCPTGPAGFIRLLDGAGCTVGTSFHLMVFSMLAGKEFWCPDAASDPRKFQLLDTLGLRSSSTVFRFGDPGMQPLIRRFLDSCRRSADSFWEAAGA